MWLNPNTGKGWTDEEEMTFLEIQQVSRLNRIQAIQLFKRFNCNKIKAFEVARRTYPPMSKAQILSLAKATASNPSHLKGARQHAKAQGGT